MNALPSVRRRTALLVLTLGTVLTASTAQADNGPLTFHTLTPCRVYNSRPPAGVHTPFAPGEERSIPVTGQCGVPADATAVVLNVTIVQPTADGEMLLYGENDDVPDAGVAPEPGESGFRFRTGRTRAALRTVNLELSPNGALMAKAVMASGQVHLILDVAGFFGPRQAKDDAATVAEDAPATPIDVLANDFNTPPGTFKIASATDPANGTVVLTGGTPGAHTGLTYQPDPNYCNSQSGGTPDTFTYTLTPAGSTATVSVTVTCVDDDPTAVDDTATVDEDAPATPIDVLANDSDADGDPFFIASASDPGNGTVVLTGGTPGAHTGLTYQPDANYCGSDSFTYTLTPGGDTATVSVTVTCLEGNPVAEDDAATVTEDAATPIDVLANDSDEENDPFSIASASDPAHGTVVLTPVGPGPYTGLTYQPDANYCGPDSFTYTLTPGGDTATVSVTVTCVDDNPVAEDDAATVTEDDQATAIDVLANDSDPEGDAFSIASASDPDHGTVVLTPVGPGPYTGLTYEPDDNYCGPDSFTYTLTPGGDLATVSMTVTCVDGGPVAVDDAATVAEDAAATAINVLANDTDEENDPFFIASASDPGHGTVVLTPVGPGPYTGLTYEPDDNYCGADSFTYALTPGGDTATVSVTVTCVEDAPAIDLDADDDKGTTGSDFAVTFTEGDAAKLIEDPADATLTDVDSATIASLTVTLTNLLDAGSEVLDADLTGFPGITKSYDTTTDPTQGVLLLTGPDTLANFQAVLRKVTYRNSDTAPDTTARVIEFVANDGTTDSAAATSTVTVAAVDSNPVAVDDAATVAEDAAATAIDVLANDSDAENDPFFIASASDPANGTVVLTGGTPGAHTGLTYQPDADYCGPDSFTYTLTPGGDSATVSITVTCADDNPVAVDDAATVLEDASATAVDVLANDSDAENDPFFIAAASDPANGTVVLTGGTPGAHTGLTYQPDANYCGPDSFTYTLTPGGDSATVSITVTCVDDNPVAQDDAATVTEDDPATAINVLANDSDAESDPFFIVSASDPANGTVVLTGGTPGAHTGLTYQPDANYCGLDSFTYTLTPGGDSATVSVTVTCVDDAPVAVDDAATVNEDDPATTIDVLANDTDIDGGTKVIASASDPAHGTVVLTGGSPGAHTGLTYQPDVNYCGADSFTYTLNGGSSATVSVTVNCVNDPPVADPDSFDYIGNTELVVDRTAPATPHAFENTGPAPFGVLEGDNDLEGNVVTVSRVEGCTDLTAPFGDGPTCATANGGTVILESDGKFSFTPKAGDTAASDSFRYWVKDDGVPSAESAAFATVTITRFERVWYVDNDAPAGGNGTSNLPFNSLASLNGAGGSGDSDSPNDYVFIHFGDGTSTGQSAGLELEANQRLRGEFAGLSIPVNLNLNGSPTVLVAPPDADDCGGGPCRPRIDNAGGNAISATEAIPVEIVGLSLSGGVNAIDLTTDAALTGASMLTIGNNVFRGAGAEGIDANLNVGTTGTLNLSITNNSWDNAGTHTGNAVDILRSAGTLNVNFSGNTNIESNTTAVMINGGAAASTTITGFSGNTVHGDTLGGGISISNATFDATAGGAVQQVDGDNLMVGASGNPVGSAGMSLTSVLGNLFFDDLDVFAGTSGLTINGAMTFAVTPASPDGSGTSTIDADNGAAVDVTSATLDLRLADLESNTSGAGVNLSSVGGQFRAPSGSSITKASGGGTAFAVASSSATVNYGGTLNVTSGSGVSLTSNTGSVNFTGQLTLNTGANPAFTATGGGTVTATDLTSALTTTTGTPLTVTSTNIGSAGLRFQSITSNGAVNGVLLSNNTGSTGRLIVGPAVGGPCNSVATCAGGAIQNSSGAAISLTNTRNVSFTEIYILNGATHGISGTTMADASGGVNPTFELKNSFLESPGDSDNESAIYFDTASVANITGRMVVSDTTIQNFEDVGIHVGNNSGTLIIDVTNVTVNNNSDTNGEEGIDVAAEGTANITLNVSGASTFTDLEGGGLNVIAQNSGVIDMNINGTSITGTGGPDNFPTPPAMTISAEGTSSMMTFDITNNDILDSSGDGIFIGHEGTIMGRLTGNDVSGMATGDGLRIDTDTTGSNTVTILVDGNNFGNVAGFTGIGDDGIQVLHRDGTKTLNLTITNNQIANTVSEGIRYFADDDVSGGGPGNMLRISGNTFSSIGDPNTIVVISQDPGTEVCTNITGNTGVTGITLQQSLSAVLQITQASTAALSAANGGATVTPTGTITFNGTCVTPPQPTNP